MWEVDSFFKTIKQCLAKWLLSILTAISIGISNMLVQSFIFLLHQSRGYVLEIPEKSQARAVANQ